MSAQRPIAVVGSLNIDLVVTTERFVAPGETVQGSAFRIVAGGKGANQAAAAARLGFPTQMYGRVGNDEFATRLLTALTETGVDVTAVETVAGSTGVAFITTAADGQNSIVVVPGANGTVRPEDIDHWWASLRKAGMILAQLEVPIGAMEQLAKRCAAEGIPLMLDPAPAQPLSPELLRAVAWLTPNESEVLRLTGQDISTADEATLRAVAQSFLEAGVGGVVLKLGERGAFVAQATAWQWIKPHAVATVDTTAAGDAFNGAFAVSLLRLNDPFAAARVAVAAAALSTTVCGAIPSMPTTAQVETLLAKSANI